MRKLFILFVAFFAATTLLAQTFQSGNLYYKVTSATAPYEVEVTYDESYSTLTTVSIPESVTNGGISYAVTAIGSATFYNCYQLQKVTIPISVTKIANNAFETAGIYNMESFWEDNMLYINDCLIEARAAFIDNKQEQLQTNYVIKEGTRIIADGAFRRVHALSTIELPSTLTHIGANALTEVNESLDTIRVNASTPPILGSYAIAGNPICYIPYGTLSLYQNSEWAKQVSDFIEDTTIIGDNVIMYTSTYQVTPYNASVFGAKIVSNTYENGHGEIIFDAPVTQIGNQAFYNNTYLQSITIPNSVTSIGSNAFYGCSNLTNVNYLGDISGWCGITFANSSSNPTYLTKKLCINGKEVAGHLEIPDNVTTIGAYAFYNCQSITALTIPYGVTYIGQNAFYGISAKSLVWNAKEAEVGNQWFYPYLYTGLNPVYYITSVAIGEGVESIPNNFLSSISTPIEKLIITVPSSVNKIGDKAFNNSYIPCILFDSKTPATIGSSVVNTKQIMGVYNVDAYIEAWPEYETNLVARDKVANPEVTISALPNKSALLEAIGAESTEKVCRLKINGTINSYDIMVLRNRMPNLVELDLADASIVANAYEYTSGRCSKNDTLTREAFTGTGTIIEKLILPKSLKYIEAGTINNKVKNLTIHNGMMATSAFAETYITSVYLSDSITTIPANTFTNCRYLVSVRLPQTLETIGNYAFQNVALDALILPASVYSIGGGAFSGGVSSNLNKYYPGSNSLTNFMTSVPPGVGQNNYYSCSAGKLKKVVIPQNSRLKSINPRVFEGNEGLTEISILGDSITKIDDLAFSKCGFDTLILPPNLTTLGRLAFSECKNLRYIVMPEIYTTVHNNAFVGCTNLDKIQFPSTLTTIEHHAFADCTNLSEVDIPGLVTNIGEGAFLGCHYIKDIYTYLFDPFTIGQNTFAAKVNANATLYVPNVDDVEMKYLYDTQWSQILNCKRMDRTFEYKDFYANGDVVIGENDESLNGNPNANLNPGSGLVVEEGENTQDLGKVTLSGSVDNWASLIAGCNTNVDTLELSLTVPGHKWHFIGFPFAVDIDNLHADHQFAIYEYDGEARATHGTTGWKVVPKSQKKLNPGHGYIIQFNTDTDCQFRIKVHQPNFCAMMNNIELKVYPSSKNNNKSWNYISNPYFAYYDINDLNYTGPITFWDIETGTYKSLRAGDDEYILSPYEAFFLQNIDENENFALVFDKNKGMTKNQSDAKKGKHAPQRQNVDAKAKRHIINISLSDDKHSDFTRLVINDDATTKYDMGMDAAKFMSTESIPQVFTYDAEHDMCAINERPMENGTIELGIKLPATGTYHFSASRMDTTFYLLDREMNITHDFTLGDYQFDGKAGNTTNRFALVRNPRNQPTDVENTTESTIDVVNDGLYVNGTAYLQIYNVSGVLILQGEFSGKVALELGVYLVVNNGITSKYVIK